VSTTNLPVADVERSLGDLVAERPAIAPVLERFGLDYCCNGHHSLAEASAALGLNPSVVAAEFPPDDGRREATDGLGTVALVDHIVAVHHGYLHEELPLLDALATKVRDVHRDRHPELERVAETVAEIRAELEPHLAKEERVLFPAIRELTEEPANVRGGDVSNRIRMMIAEHERAGDLLRELRTVSGDYRVPDDGCTSYHMLYERLEALEADTHRHIHLENNVLFPAVLADDDG